MKISGTGSALAGIAVLGLCAFAQAQPHRYECGFGGEENAEKLVHALSEDKTCSVAADRLWECRWGSSADTEFAPIVISKCEKDFYHKLSPAGKDRYAEEMQLCAYQYSRQQGTLAMSEAAMCQVSIASEYAVHPECENLPPLRASFDCQKPHSPLEKAICSDTRLGHADIVLNKVYQQTLRVAKGNDRQKLIASQRKWLGALPVQCDLAGSSKPELQRLCLRDQLERRFTKLDCEEISDCIQSLDEPEDRSSDFAERASFDCEKPATALQLVVCADAELGQKDIQLADLFKAASAQVDDTQRSELSASQNMWSEFVQKNCPMGVVGGIPPLLARACISEAYEQRIKQVQTCARKSADQQKDCLESFRVFQDQSER